MTMQFYPLKITALQKPIPDATTVTFDIPEHWVSHFIYQAGQHLVLKFDIGGQEVRRSYSLNSSPYYNEPLQITVKRVKDGLVSNYINSTLSVGDTIEVMPPQGRFYATIEANAYKTYFLFAAGSGITPIFSILKTVLYTSPYSQVYLFYGNTNQDTIIFDDELTALANQFSKRLTVVHTLSDPKVWTSWTPWKGRQGRIDAEAVEWFITQHPPIAQQTEYYICGPANMNTSIQKTLTELGIPKPLIHIEQFGGLTNTTETTINSIPATLHLTLRSQQHTLQLKKNQTVLSALKTAKLNPPYSCESGVCGTCVAQLKKGKVEMKACMALEDADIEKGLILTCQALAVSERLELTL